MPNAVRRVGGTSEAQQTYTLGPAEHFRLDACSFKITYAQQGFNVAPTLIAADQGGFVFAKIAAPIVFTNAPSFNPFAFTGPAVMGDDFSVLPPDGYGGYLLHDFGAVPVTSQITLAWDQPPGLQGWAAELWLRSPGAASMGPLIGTATATDAETVTVALSSGIAAGHYLLLHVTYLGTQNWINPVVADRPIVTDSVGGNIVDYSGIPLGGFAVTSLQRTDGQYLSSACYFYRIVNALSAGGTVTLRNVRGVSRWLSLNVHDITGLTVGNPIGPNAGGNYTQIGQAPAVSPSTSVAVPTPKWVGPVLINDAYLVPLGLSIDTQFSRGSVEIMPVPFSFDSGSQSYSQATLPELHFGPGDTLTAASYDQTGLRVEDTVSDFLVWGIDE